MQVKKDEMKLAIMNAAEKEFVSKGFEHASIRKIVKTAGTTIGNFYNYFENKETLFSELVQDEYTNFFYFIENHNDFNQYDYLIDIKDVSEWRSVLSELIQRNMPLFSDRFLLLVEYSKGTRFENTRIALIELLKRHFAEHIEQSGPEYKDSAFSEIIAEQFLNGLLLILKKCRDEKLRNKLLTDYILLYFIGTMGILGLWK